MSFNFAFFNGEVTRDKKQEALMRSLNERNNFLQNLNALSEQRLLDEKKNKASKKIQKRWKQFRVKKQKRQEFRDKFDEIAADEPKNSALILNLLVNFYDRKLDSDRLILGLSEAVRLSRDNTDAAQKILSDSKKIILARCCMEFMRASTPQTNFFMVFRFFETFIFTQHQIFETVVNMGFFDAQFALLVGVTDPKPMEIAPQKKPGPRCQQVISRIFSIFEKTHPPHAPLIYQKFIASLTNSLPDLFFCNFFAQQFAQFLTPTNVHFAKFLEHGNVPNLKFQCLVLEQSAFLENVDMLPAYFDCLARCMVVEKNLKSRRNEDDMEVEDVVDTFLRERIEAILESAKFKRIAQAYANLDHFNVLTIIALQRQFLKIIDLLAMSENFMRLVWDFIRKSIDDHGSFDETGENVEFLKSALILFCGCVKNRLSTIADSEFQPDIVIENFVGVLYLLRDVCLKLFNLVHPDLVGAARLKAIEMEQRLGEARKKWQNVCDAVVATLQVAHEKDERLKFLHANFWTDHNQSVVVTKWGDQRSRIGASRNVNEDATFVEQLLADYDSESEDSSDDEDNRKKLTPRATRNLSIMRNIPFIVPFMQRVKIFSNLLIHHRRRNNPAAAPHVAFDDNGMIARGHQITVRREFLYDDAFDALGPRRGVAANNAIDIREPIRVKMINWVGQNEAGMDGGGIYREFLNEVLTDGFAAFKLFFQSTPDGLLYPNPQSMIVYGTDYVLHFQFLGRMLAKLILEKQLIELRFAEFFLAQLFGSQKNDVDLQHMKMFDPEVFQHLRELTKMSNEELDELVLDFSVVIMEWDVAKKVNLKPNGESIRVNAENVQEYVRLYVNFQLRVKYSPMVNAMRKGISEVMNIEWLSMFSVAEIQTLIAGIETVFDVDDMKRHCVCLNIRNAADQQYYEMFWEVVHQLSADDKTALLKFITGVSRPPIEGFKQIVPPLGVYLIDEDQSLPTSATCMNMLKLPKYNSRQLLEEKLRYAINAGAGFELI